MAARESFALGPSGPWRTPKEQPPPESLRHEGPRTPDSLESVPDPVRGRRRGKALRRSRQTGAAAKRPLGRWPSHPFAGAQLMSREVHNGPTDETQARGTPYSGDPQGGAGTAPQPLDKLPLDAWHRSRGARMVPFAGYEMPVQYEGIMAEHLWTRENAGLFDVSHMGQLLVHGEEVDAALESLMPGDFRAAADMKPKYSLLLDDDGGIVDDLMATRRGDDFYVVVNGATKHGDIAVMQSRLPGSVVVDYMKEQALLALQGPRAAEVLETLIPGVSEMSFMQGAAFHWQGRSLWISRSGYTGEDGFEISVPAIAAADLADAIGAPDRAKTI